MTNQPQQDPLLAQRPRGEASPRQVLLGLFILAQIAFLLLQNLAMLIRTDDRGLADCIAPKFSQKKGHGWVWFQQAEGVLNRWAELTGQHQSWSMFAPGVGDECAFPVIVLLDEDDGPAWTQHFDPVNGFSVKFEREPGVMLRSPAEPKDVHGFFRIGDFRIRYYTNQVEVSVLPAGGKLPQFADTMNDRLRHINRELAIAYMKWSQHCWQREHAAARQVILMQRTYRIHGPEEGPGWDGPFLVPQLRWRPGSEDVETYDFVTQRFVPW